MAKFCRPMRQTWAETSQYPYVISTNPVGHSDKAMKHSKVALSSICAQCTPLPYRLYSYLGNIQVTAPVGNSSFQAGKSVTLSVRGIVQLENEIFNFDNQNCQQLMLTGVAEGYCYICGGPFPLDFHKVPYSPESYVTIYFAFTHWVTFLHTSHELWKRRLQ